MVQPGMLTLVGVCACVCVRWHSAIRDVGEANVCAEAGAEPGSQAAGVASLLQVDASRRHVLICMIIRPKALGEGWNHMRCSFECALQFW
jgi:hypothetical protein